MTMLQPAQGRLDAWQGVDFDFAFTLYEDDEGTVPVDLTGHVVQFSAAPSGIWTAVIDLTEGEGLTLTHDDEATRTSSAA
jgi:hypothetical protein